MGECFDLPAAKPAAKWPERQFAAVVGLGIAIAVGLPAYGLVLYASSPSSQLLLTEWYLVIGLTLPVGALCGFTLYGLRAAPPVRMTIEPHVIRLLASDEKQWVVRMDKWSANLLLVSAKDPFGEQAYAVAHVGPFPSLATAGLTLAGFSALVRAAEENQMAKQETYSLWPGKWKGGPRETLLISFHAPRKRPPVVRGETDAQLPPH